MSSASAWKFDENKNITMEEDKQNVEVLYTPKLLLSEEPLTSNTFIKEICRKVKEYENSRARLLQKISAHSRVAGTKSLFPSSTFGLLDTNRSITSPNHQPEESTLGSRQSHRVVPPMGDNTKDIVTLHPKSVPRITFGDTICTWTLQNNQSKNELLYINRIPPKIRIRVVERLLQIRDDIVDIVTFLLATGFGGRDFRWSSRSLQAYGITKIPPLRVPKQFQSFAVLE
ncbi:unnamed protein product [Allacma fusca]|uniref:Uncharacterized protein n=1 Tax=Allacma fusca TaxID=39272 RepID=A0A8J2M8G3_9HEXA|nr:unnamed protein product [Allacma fusca]